MEAEPPAPAPFVDLCALAEVPENEFITRKVGRLKLVVARDAAGVHVVENQCSHARAAFDGGLFRHGEIHCPLHGARFCVQTGAHRGPPAHKPIRAFEARISGERVEARLPQDGATEPPKMTGLSPF